MKQPVQISFPLGGMFLLLFVTLKLCHVIDWSWWWVLSPLWIPVVLAGGLAIGFWLAWVGCLLLAYVSLKRREPRN